MGKRVVYFSDLTSRTFQDDRNLERVVVIWHPALENGPVELDVSKDEIESLRSGALHVVSLKLPEVNGSPPETKRWKSIRSTGSREGGISQTSSAKQNQQTLHANKTSQPQPTLSLSQPRLSL
jgi:hypothetical protein